MPTLRTLAPWIGAAAMTLAPTIAYAQVYKCAGDKGIPVYQEMPCPPGKELRNFQTDPPEITILPSRRPTGNPAEVIRDTPPKNGKAPLNPEDVGGTSSTAEPGPLIESVCAENNVSYFGSDALPIPTAKTADF